MLIRDFFRIDTARSKSTDDYLPGEVPFVTNTESNNGVVSYVEPFEEDKVFESPAICISGLGYATVHLIRFLPKGNGGDSCTVLTPHGSCSNAELLYYAALFNTLHKWRFSFGRKANKRRLEKLDLKPIFKESPVKVVSESEEKNALMIRLLQENYGGFRTEV